MEGPVFTVHPQYLERGVSLHKHVDAQLEDGWVMSHARDVVEARHTCKYIHFDIRVE